MTDNELLIRINADAKNAKKAFDDLRAQTEDLEGVLSDVAKVSAVAFAAFTAEIYLSVKAFEESEQASRQLANALQNQGIYTKELAEDYKAYAEQVQAVTGLDDDAIVSAQAVAQSFLGQTKVTKELTQAIADYAQFTGSDLNTAATILSKTIGTNTNALARSGLQLSDTATEAQKYAKVLEFVNTRAGGLAEQANQGIGGLRGLQTAFGNLQEDIGKNFAPALAGAITFATKFINALRDNPEIAKFAAAVVAGGAALAGLATVIPGIIIAASSLSAAMTALGLSFNLAFFGIPLLIAGVVTALAYMALNVDKTVRVAQASLSAFGAFCVELFEGVAKVIAAAFTFDSAKLTAGLEQIKGSFSAAAQAYAQTSDEILAKQVETDTKQDAQKKAAADKAAAIERAETQRRVALARAQTELLRLENEHASQQAIELKNQEIATLRALGEQRSAEDLQLLRDRRAQILALQEEQRVDDAARAEEYQAVLAEARDAQFAEEAVANAQFRDSETAAQQAALLTRKDAEKQVLAETLKQRTEARNQELLDQAKYGVAYATINKAIHSDEIQGARQATDDLVQLTQSKNATLKAIGKAAAVANIAIKTSESAMNIYAGFSTIPIIGPALGLAGAAAAIAFGAERTIEVLAAKDGGLVEGGIPGKDSVPALLEPGEVVVPRRNFADVFGESPAGRGAGNESMLELLKSIDAKLEQPTQVVIQGDVMADDTFVDQFVRKISDAVEFRNAKIVGVNA